MSIERAAIWALLGGYLLLPSGASYDVQLLPPLDKSLIPSVTTFLLCWSRGSRFPPPRRSILIYLTAGVFVFSPLLTTFSNSYELRVGDRSIPGFYPMDAIKMALHNLFTLAPFFVGMRFLSTDSARVHLLKAWGAAAIYYSLPILLEIRISPQLHRLVYGYTPATFIQQVRAGGYRAVVFMTNGLEVALFVAMAVIASMIVFRLRGRVWKLSAGSAAGYLSAMLLLCKTLGAALYALICGPLILLTGPRVWTKVALILIVTVCAYPALRTYDLIPVHRIADAAASVSADRSSSFQFRVRNEDLLLAKANEKPMVGWGTWGRNRVYEEGTGQDLSITDGAWIIQFGMFGWVGYLSLFGLFALAVVRSIPIVRGPLTTSSVALGGISLLLAVNMVDMLPNAALTPLTFAMAGSVAGCVRRKAARRVRKPITRQPAVIAQSSRA